MQILPAHTCQTLGIQRWGEKKEITPTSRSYHFSGEILNTNNTIMLYFLLWSDIQGIVGAQRMIL